FAQVAGPGQQPGSTQRTGNRTGLPRRPDGRFGPDEYVAAQDGAGPYCSKWRQYSTRLAELSERSQTWAFPNDFPRRKSFSKWRLNWGWTMIRLSVPRMHCCLPLWAAFKS